MDYNFASSEFAQDPYLAFLSYRVTSLARCQLSPAELLMGRRLRTTVPQITKAVHSEMALFGRIYLDKTYKEKQKREYDSCYVLILPDLAT